HIDLGGGGGGAVAQSAADAEEGNVPAVGDGGEGVAQAVEGHIGQVGAGQDSLEAVAEVVGLVGQPSVVAQDESPVHVLVTQARFFLLPLPPQPLDDFLQIRQALVAQAADRGPVLGLLVHGPAVDGSAGL